MNKKIIDITGTILTPSFQGRKCLGNGRYAGYECCCEECDYYLDCFPQFNPKIKPIKISCKIKTT